MGTGIDQRESQNVILYQIDEKPVRFNVTFVEPCKITFKNVVLIFFIENLALTQYIYDIIEKGNV